MGFKLIRRGGMDLPPDPEEDNSAVNPPALAAAPKFRLISRGGTSVTPKPVTPAVDDNGKFDPFADEAALQSEQARQLGELPGQILKAGRRYPTGILKTLEEAQTNPVPAAPAIDYGRQILETPSTQPSKPITPAPTDLDKTNTGRLFKNTFTPNPDSRTPVAIAQDIGKRVMPEAVIKDPANKMEYAGTFLKEALKDLPFATAGVATELMTDPINQLIPAGISKTAEAVPAFGKLITQRNAAPQWAENAIRGFIKKFGFNPSKIPTLDEQLSSISGAKKVENFDQWKQETEDFLTPYKKTGTLKADIKKISDENNLDLSPEQITQAEGRIKDVWSKQIYSAYKNKNGASVLKTPEYLIIGDKNTPGIIQDLGQESPFYPGLKALSKQEVADLLGKDISKVTAADMKAAADEHLPHQADPMGQAVEDVFTGKGTDVDKQIVSKLFGKKTSTSGEVPVEEPIGEPVANASNSEAPINFKPSTPIGRPTTPLGAKFTGKTVKAAPVSVLAPGATPQAKESAFQGNSWEVPAFKSTEEAMAFGKTNKNNSEAIIKLQGLRRDSLAKSKALMALPEPTTAQLQEGMNEAFRGQLYREALESAGGITKPIVPQEEGNPTDIAEPGAKFNAGPEKPFYSKLIQVIDERMPNSTTPEQVLGIIKSGGVKDEEAQWMGLDDFLSGKAKVSKTELQDFLKQNQVEVQEVEKGGSVGDVGQASESYNNYVNELKRKYDPSGRMNISSLIDSGEISKEDMDRFSQLDSAVRAARAGDTKFKSYQLSGGENYRELLLTLPEKSDGVKGPKGWGDTGGGTADTVNFRSQHFDEPNILAHVRMNDRTDADGKKVLFIEEVQSDWHQKGKKKGYGGKLSVDEQQELKHLEGEYKAVRKEVTKPVTIDELEKYFTPGKIVKGYGGWDKVLAFHKNDRGGWTVDVREVSKDGTPKSGTYAYDRNHSTTPDLNELRTGIVDKERQIYRRIMDLKNKEVDVVPDAPFKKTWHELALKRMLRYAVENGYDRLSWTTGEQQAERYDLSKHVEKIHYGKNQSNELHVTVLDPNGKHIWVSANTNPKELEDVIGKELAQKISDTAEVGQKTLSGLDLKVGGQGMKGFYDQILPSFMNKYTKKWGGRVGKASITSRQRGKNIPDGAGGIVRVSDVPADVQVHSIDITPSMKESILGEGQPLFEKGAEFGSQEEINKSFGSQEKAEAAVKKVAEEAAAVHPAPKTKFSGPATNNYDISARKIAKDFLDKGYVDHVGYKVTGPGDIAALASIFRSPYIEHFQVVYLKQGVVVGHNVMTSGMPHKVDIKIKKGGFESHHRPLYRIHTAATRLGADEVYFAHNHPSGDPQASKEDILYTRVAIRVFEQMSEYLGKKVVLKGHVITDSGKFGLIDKATLKMTIPGYEVGNLSEKLPALHRPAGKIQLNNPRKVAVEAKGLLQPGRVAVVYTTNNLNTVAIGIYRKEVDLDRIIREEMKAHLAPRYFITYKTEDAPAPFERLPNGLELIVEITPRGYTSRGPAGINIVGAGGKLKFIQEKGADFNSEEYQGEIPWEETGTPAREVKPLVPGSASKLNIKDQASQEKAMKEIGGHPLEDAIKDIGKIRYYTGGQEAEEIKGIPARFLSSTGKPLDEVRQELEENHGIHFDSTSDLRAALKRLGDKSKRFTYSAEVQAYLKQPKLQQRFSKDEITVLRQMAKQKGLILQSKTGNIVNRQNAILYHYKDASYDELMKYFSEVTGSPNNPPLVLKVTGDVNKDTELMKAVNKVSAGWDDINKMEVHSLDLPRAIEKVTGLNLWDPDNLLAANIFDAISGADSARFDRLNKELKDMADNAPGFVKETKASADLMSKLESGGPFTPEEQKIADFFRKKYDMLFAEDNAVRRRFGRPEIPYRKNYFTHIREYNLLNELFHGDTRKMDSLTNEQMQLLRKSEFTKPNAKFNRHALQRKGPRTKLDAIGNYERYLDTVLSEIYLLPAISHARKFSEYALIRQPNMYKSVRSVLNELAGKPSAYDNNILGLVASSKVVKWLRQRIAKNALVANINFNLVNAANVTTSSGELGHYVARGLKRFLSDPNMRRLAFENSTVLQSRKSQFDADVKSIQVFDSKNYSHLTPVEMAKIAAKQLEYLAGGLTRMIEYNNVGATWCGAYMKAVEKLHMSHKTALKYSDTVARRTQVGYRTYELPAVMRSNYGKTLLMFQSWAFSAMNHLIYDLKLGNIPKQLVNRARGIGPGKDNDAVRYRNFIMLLAVLMLINAIYKKFGWREPTSAMSAFPKYSNPMGQLAKNIWNSGLDNVVKPIFGWKRVEHKPETLAKNRGRAASVLLPFGGTQAARLMEGNILPDNGPEAQKKTATFTGGRSSSGKFKSHFKSKFKSHFK